MPCYHKIKNIQILVRSVILMEQMYFQDAVRYRDCRFPSFVCGEKMLWVDLTENNGVASHGWLE